MRLLPSAALGAACLLGAAWFTLGTAHAAPIKKRFQFQLQTSVLSLDASVIDDASTQQADESVVSVGGTNRNTRFGLNARGGAGLGYAPSEHLNVHLLFGFVAGSSSAGPTDAEKQESDDSQIEAMLSARYVAGQPDSTLRAFLGGGLGMLGANATQNGAQASSSTAGLLTLLFGVHAFIHPNLSFDPTLELSALRSSITVWDVETHATGFRALLTLGMTGWFGGSADEPEVANGQQPSGQRTEQPRVETAPATSNEEAPPTATSESAPEAAKQALPQTTDAPPQPDPAPPAPLTPSSTP